MAPPVTEIAYITLKPGKDLEQGESAKVWQETLATLRSQDGMQRTYYGPLIEAPNVVALFVDWETRQHHQKFIESPVYEPFTKNLDVFLESLHLHHFVPTPFPPAVLSQAPVIEFVTMFGAEEGLVGNVAKFMEGVGKPEGFVGYSYGATVESDVVKHAEQGSGADGSQAVVLLIGWESKDAHMRFRETETFKKYVGLLREKNGGAEMFHVHKIKST